MELFPAAKRLKGRNMCKVSVIIPNYNGKKYLKDCLDAMENQSFRDFEVLLVDNGSEDGSREYVEEVYPWVRLIPLSENTGFCGAVNQGIKKSSSPLVILLNNDTIAEKNFVEELVKGMESKPRAFSCQAKLLEMRHQDRVDDAGNYYCALGWAFADGKGKPEENYNREKKIFASCAGAAIYRRELLDKTGFFDEEHFAYLEDLDIGYRGRLLGYENWFCPKARVLHVGSGTTGSRYNLFKVRYSSRNNVYLIYKNMPLLQIIWNLPLFILGFGVKMAFFTMKGFGREYAAGLKNGIAISAKNREKKFHALSVKRYLEIQLELYKNLGKFLIK